MPVIRQADIARYPVSLQMAALALYATEATPGPRSTPNPPSSRAPRAKESS